MLDDLKLVSARLLSQFGELWRWLHARCREDKRMDWQGQQLAEQIMQYALLMAAVLAFLVGYIMGSFQLMIQVYGALVCVVLLIIVPDWGCFNRHPMEWLDPKIAAESNIKSKAQVTTTKKPSKASKK